MSQLTGFIYCNPNRSRRDLLTPGWNGEMISLSLDVLVLGTGRKGKWISLRKCLFSRMIKFHKLLKESHEKQRRRREG